jgi:hypothetical protein
MQFLQATPLLAGLAVAAAALAGRYSIQAWNAYKARPVVPRMRKFYEGGFQPTMTRREAALILGVRCTLHNICTTVEHFLCFSFISISCSLAPFKFMLIWLELIVWG